MSQVLTSFSVLADIVLAGHINKSQTIAEEDYGSAIEIVISRIWETVKL
jgi:hypothetical protein